MWRRLSAALLVLLIPAALSSQTGRGAAEEEIIQVVRQYLDARLANDTATVRQILSETYTGINSNGAIEDRTSALRLPMNVTPVGRPIVAFEQESIQVRVYGTTAIMTGVRKPRGPSGSTGAGVRFTTVLLREGSRWQIAASQATDIRMPEGAR